MSEVHRPLWDLHRTSRLHGGTADMSSGLKARTDIEIGTSVEAESFRCSTLELGKPTYISCACGHVADCPGDTVVQQATAARTAHALQSPEHLPTPTDTRCAAQ